MNHHKIYNIHSRTLESFARPESLARAIASCCKGQQRFVDYQQILEHTIIERLQETGHWPHPFALQSGASSPAKTISAEVAATCTTRVTSTVNVTHRPLTAASSTVTYTTTACKPSVGEIHVSSPVRLSRPMPAPASFVRNRGDEEDKIGEGGACYWGTPPSRAKLENPGLADRRPGGRVEPITVVGC